MITSLSVPWKLANQVSIPGSCGRRAGSKEKGLEGAVSTFHRDSVSERGMVSVFMELKATEETEVVGCNECPAEDMCDVIKQVRTPGAALLRKRHGW